MFVDKINHATHKAKEWATKHKTEIIVYGSVAVCVVAGVLIYKRLNIVKPSAVSQAALIITPTPEVDIIQPCATIREISRSEHIRSLHDRWHASLAKLAEAAEKGIELKEGETIVDACTLRICA